MVLPLDAGSTPFGDNMAHYRLYFFDSLDQIGRALDLECVDDDEATARVCEQEHPFATELWQGARCVRTFSPARLEVEGKSCMLANHRSTG